MGENLTRICSAHVKKSWKTAFFSVVILGVLIHFYKFANTLPNQDSLYNYYNTQNSIHLGRWFLTVACGISSYFDLPWVNGILSVLWIAAAAVVIADIFRMENPYVIVLSGAILVSFPAVTETLFFGFTADGYMMALFLASLAVRLTMPGSDRKGHFMLAVVCVCLCCAIYQAYVSFALVLALCCFAAELLEHRHSTGEYVRWGLKQIFLYAAALGLYYVVWKLCLRVQGAGVSAYQGVDSLGLSAATILHAVPKTAQTLGLFFLEWNVMEHGWSLYSVLNVIFLLGLGAVLIWAVSSTGLYRNRTAFLLLILAVLAIPFAACLWLFTSDGVSYRPMMLHSLAVLYIFAAVLFERYTSPAWKSIAGVVLTVIVFNFGIMANIGYYYMHRSYENSYATGSEIVARLHLMEPETNRMVVIGELNEENGAAAEAHADKIHLFAHLLTTDLLYDRWHTIYFINNTFGENFEKVTEEEYSEWVQRPEVAEMECWPAVDSIRIIDDTIVLKLNECE